MSEYVIVTDSSADLPNEMVQEMGLAVLPLKFNIGEHSYYNYADNREMSPEDFYAKVKDGAMPTTSAVNPEEFVAGVTPILESGKDALILAFSSGLSTTYQSAKIAADELSEKFPERKVYAVDTLCASLGQGLIVYLAWQQKQAGKTIEEVRDWVEDNKLHLCHWFTVDDLMHLKRGGRVSAATALLGTMLQIKPVLHVDNDGHLINMGKARGRKASLDALVAKVGETGMDVEGQTIFISHSNCLADAKYVGEEIQKKYHAPKVVYNFIGPVIGSHTGVGCVALFFLGKER